MNVIKLKKIINTLSFKSLKDIFIFDSIDSTNTYVMEYHTELQSCSIVIAMEQSSGRGRYSREWQSSRGGLWFTLLSKPEKSIDDILPLYYIIPISIIQTLKKYGVSADLKWPNDILIDGKKIAGILVDTVILKKNVEIMAIGCGINLDNNIPEELSDNAINLNSIIDEQCYEKFTIDFLCELDNVIFMHQNKLVDLTKVAQGYFTGICENYVLRNNYSVIFSGEIIEITSKGELVMRNDSGEVRKFSYGEIFEQKE